MSQSNSQLLSRLSRHNAIILEDECSGCVSYTAYPNGDRRCRPISWIRPDDFRRMLSAGEIAKGAKGFEIVPSAQRRADVSSDDAHAGQHRNMESQSFSGEQGSFRAAKVNLNTQSGIRALARRLEHDGEAFLTAAEISAGESFTADYSRAAYGVVQTQNYATTGAGSGRHENSAELASIVALDSRKRLKQAQDFMGPGLSQAVMAICAKDMGLEQLERAEGWAKRSGKTVLKLGLQRLVSFYGSAPGLYPCRSADAPSARASL